MSGILTRRELLRAAAALPVVTWLPSVGVRAGESADRVLVLVELAGGNDSLNTVIPLYSREYHRHRPTLAIPRDQAVHLTERFGLHPALQPLMPAWRAGDLAICLGVGHPDLTRSHYRSLRVWDTGGEAGGPGWVARALQQRQGAPRAAGPGFIAAAGPLRGSGRVQQAGADVFSVGAPATCGADSAGVIDPWSEVSAEVIEFAACSGQGPPASPSSGGIHAALATAGRLIASSPGITAIKLRQGGFDTHENQPARHGALLAELARGLGDLRAHLVRGGHWEQVLIMTYSEFGRTWRENAAGGTDHGGAGSVLLLGGGLRKGLYGRHPSFDEAQRFAIDLRQVYATIARRWWHVAAPTGFASLDFLT